MSDHADMAFPRAPLVAAGTLVVLALVVVALVRITGVGVVRVPDAPAVETREFRFADRSDGSIDVLDARANRVVDTVAPGTNGFLRSTLRGMARERKRSGIGEEPPFELVGRADGRLTLIDPSTKRVIDLESFGPTNAAVFARLLPPAPQRP